MYFDYTWICDYLDNPPDIDEAIRVLNLTGLETEREGDGLEIEHTVNRPDAMSHFGVARELAVRLDLELCEPPGYEGTLADLPHWSITSEDADQCPRYMGLLIDKVRNEPSPEWLRQKMVAIDQTSHGFLVDLTNFLLWEYGHPNHAFDAALVADRKIHVRFGRKGERLTTLDGQDHDVEGLLCITDPEKPIALAGVMGGQNSEVGAETRTLLFELAVFEPVTVRRAGNRENIHSDARHRFERGVDREQMERVVRRFIHLVLQQQPDAVVVGLQDMNLQPFQRNEVLLRRAMMDRVLGISLPDAEVEGLLERMHCQRERRGSDWLVRVPGYKVDVTREADVIEEIIRFAGFDRLVTDLPPMAGADLEPDPVWDGTAVIRQVLQGLGLQEAMTYSFTPENWDAAFHREGAPIRLRNPMNANQAVLRRMILPGLLSVVRGNLNRGNADIRLFESGHTFASDRREPHHLAIVLSDARERDQWWPAPDNHPFYTIKGVFETLAARLGWGEALEVATPAPHWLTEGEALGIYHRGTCIGGFGTLSPAVVRACEDFEIEPAPVVLELDLSFLNTHRRAREFAEDLSPFPGIKIDMAFVLDREHDYGAVRQHLLGLDLEHLESLDLFDVYTGKSVAKGKKSLGFRFRFRSPERTLTGDEVNRTMERVTGSVQKAFGAVIRM